MAAGFFKKKKKRSIKDWPDEIFISCDAVAVWGTGRMKRKQTKKKKKESVLLIPC